MELQEEIEKAFPEFYVEILEPDEMGRLMVSFPEEKVFQSMMKEEITIGTYRPHIYAPSLLKFRGFVYEKEPETVLKNLYNIEPEKYVKSYSPNSWDITKPEAELTFPIAVLWAKGEQ